MKTTNQKTTLYLNPTVKKFLQHKAVAEDRTMSEIVNDYFADMLEDFSDIKEVNKRKSEPTTNFEEVLNLAGLKYDDLRS